VRAVGGAEGVVHPDVAEPGQLAGEGVVVRLLLGVEAQVLEEQDVTVLEVLHQLADAVADAVVGEDDVLVEELRQPGGRRLQREAGAVLRLALGPAQVRGEDEPRAGPQRVLERGQRGADARVVGHAPLRVERDVEVHAHEHALARQVELIDGPQRHPSPPRPRERARARLRLRYPEPVEGLRLKRPQPAAIAGSRGGRNLPAPRRRCQRNPA